MKARRTGSGTTSVLIEPWRKNFRSSADHFGICAESMPSFFFWSAEEEGVVTIAAISASRAPMLRRKLVGFIEAILESRAKFVKRRPQQGDENEEGGGIQLA